MKLFKKTISLVTAMAIFIVVSLSAITISAEKSVKLVEKEIAYNGPSAGAFALENDGVSLRLNIFNEWGASVKDINNKGEFLGKVAVTFTIDGLGENSANIYDDGTEVPYEAFLSGSIGSDFYWGETADDNTVENKHITIKGDGTYTAEFLLNDPADVISCLMLTTNICSYQYTKTGKPADTGITFTVNKITTMGEGAAIADETPTAYVAGAIGATTVWAADEVTAGSKTATINGDAQYEVIWNVDDSGADKLEMLFVEIPNLTTINYPDLSINIDGVYIDGIKLSNYSTDINAIYTSYLEGTKSSTRIYLIDSWAGTYVKDILATTAIHDNIKVKFTVSGMGKIGTSNVVNDSFVGLSDASGIAGETVSVPIYFNTDDYIDLFVLNVNFSSELLLHSVTNAEISDQSSGQVIIQGTPENFLEDEGVFLNFVIPETAKYGDLYEVSISKGYGIGDELIEFKIDDSCSINVLETSLIGSFSLTNVVGQSGETVEVGVYNDSDIVCDHISVVISYPSELTIAENCLNNAAAYSISKGQIKAEFVSANGFVEEFSDIRFIIPDSAEDGTVYPIDLNITGYEANGKLYDNAISSSGSITVVNPAVEVPDDVFIGLSDAIGKAGDSVSVELNIGLDCGVNAYSVIVEYPSDLILESVDRSVANIDNGKSVIFAINTMKLFSGNVATLNFTIPKTAKANDQYLIKLSVLDFGIDGVNFINPIVSNGVITVSGSDFYTLDGVIYDIFDDHAEVVGGEATLSEVIIPETVSGVPVTKIVDCAFYGCSIMINITIPESVVEIGKNALGYVAESNDIAEFKIYGAKNSAAQAYAFEYGMLFFDEDQSGVITYSRGDVNKSGELDLYDVIKIAKYMLKSITFTEEEYELADYDENGLVNLYDAIGIAKALLKK